MHDSLCPAQIYYAVVLKEWKFKNYFYLPSLKVTLTLMLDFCKNGSTRLTGSKSNLNLTVSLHWHGEEGNGSLLTQQIVSSSVTMAA